MYNLVAGGGIYVQVNGIRHTHTHTIAGHQQPVGPRIYSRKKILTVCHNFTSAGTTMGYTAQHTLINSRIEIYKLYLFS